MKISKGQKNVIFVFQKGDILRKKIKHFQQLLTKRYFRKKKILEYNLTH